MRWRTLTRTASIGLVCSTLLASGATAGQEAAAMRNAAEAEPGERSKQTVRLLGEQRVPKGTVVDGTDVGELSGVDYDRASDRWYLIADDTERGPARIFTADLDLDARGLHAVDIRSATSILRSDGSEFPSFDTDDPEVADPESIRWDQKTRTFWWSSEGKRDPESGHALVMPWVRQMAPSGAFLDQVEQPSQFRVDQAEFGPQPNGAFEALSLSWSGRMLVTGMESPLYQDGVDGNVHRLTFYDKRSGEPARQFAYEADELGGMGITEILAESPHRYLVVERNYVPDEGNTIRVYRVDLRGATDVLGRDSLADGNFRPVRKKLLVDFTDDLREQGLEHVDNIEAVSWGPRLATGERSLVFVSDDNFNDDQVSQVVALAVRR